MIKLKTRHLRWNIRIVYIWVLLALWTGFLIIVLPGITIERWPIALFAAIFLGYINARIRHFLLVFSINPTLVVFGLVTMFLNTLILWLGNRFVQEIQVHGLSSPVLLVFGVTLVNVTFSDMLAIDDDDSYYAHFVRQIVDLVGKPIKSETPGVIFLEIDGLGEQVLRRALQNGYMPTLQRWVDGGSHRILRWECDLSSQTSASQAGILLGDNFDIPAFRWYEKDRGRRMVSNHPTDTVEIERRLSRGKGLLKEDGSSCGNLFSGDAPQAVFTFSRIADMSKKRSEDFFPVFMGPYNFIRIILLFIWDAIIELRAASYQRRKDIRPRVHRGGLYPLLRAATTVVLRELSVQILIGDVITGVPCVYATFVGYDEVAHHSGVERPDALDVLSKLDEQFDRLEDIVRIAPRPYKFVILSDHGQSQGATFKQRHGLTLEQVVREIISEEQTVESIHSEDAGWGNVSVFLTELLRDFIPGSERFAARLMRWWTKQRRFLDQVVLGPYRDFLHTFGPDSEPAEANVIVMASGNLGLIYFTKWEERLSYEKIKEEYPGLIEGLANHEGIGFLLVHSEEHGPLVVGRQGVHYLENNTIEGEDPLADFSANAPRHLQRTSGFPHVADIMVNSMYDTETDEVAAFEELVGSHGGMGGDQSFPFVMYPSEWQVEDEHIVGAPQLHAQFKQWLDEYSAAAPVPPA